MLHALIMAGGGGTRFWPRSRQRRPKQFLTLTGDRSLLQQSLDRVEAQVPAEFHGWLDEPRLTALMRQADVLARKVVGPLWPSVFITPVRRALQAADHATASAINREITGHGSPFRPSG